MALESKKMKYPRKIMVKELNPSLTCNLCGGYYIDATAIIDCLHVFCRGCILRYFENSKIGCPTCQTVYKKKNQPCFSSLLRPDNTIQSLVYKVVPGLYSKEMQRREDFYRSTNNRASSSCSDDSVLGEQMQDHEEWISAAVTEPHQYFSPDDLISLSLEYYQSHLDSAPEKQSKSTENSTNVEKISANYNNGHKVSNPSDNKDAICDETKVSDRTEQKTRDRRYLQCPAAVCMSLLQKFIRMKYALSPEHKVDIIYEGEVLPNYFSLMDVAYTFKWERVKPMRFFYRIFTPMKIRPIKIINTASTTGEKQLQIVPVKSEPKVEAQEALAKAEMDAQTYRNKERLMAELQLQSKEKALANAEKERAKKLERDEKALAEMKKSYQEKLEKYNKTAAGLENKPEKRKRSPEVCYPVKKKASPEPDCVYEYEEPDKEEIKRFAEKRDREWAMQKKMDEIETHHVSKKRKKNKHSKNELYKKRKIHAEITSSEVNQEESIKLKLKVTPHNGHKHKHHKVVIESPSKSYELSNKEKLMQMRAVRHKNISTDSEKKNNDASTNTPPIVIKKEEAKIVEKPSKEEKIEEAPKKEESEISKLHIRIKSPENSVKIVANKEVAGSKIKTAKDMCYKNATVQIERNEQTERQAQTTFLKTFQSHPQDQEKPKDIAKKEVSKPKQFSAALERKIATLQQQCTIEPRNSPTPPTNQNKQETTKIPEKVAIEKQTQYPSGFTVSKIEAGVNTKKKEEEKVEKRPSLEITLIPSSTPPPKSSPAEVKTTTVKRPPPATIPLDRIKNKINLKSGISIIPKVPEKCDNIGALDLTKSKTLDVKVPNGVNGNGLVNKDVKMAILNTTVNKIVERAQEKKGELSNLQMLSKVASEHSILNKNQSPLNKIRPQIQSLKIPLTQTLPSLKPASKLPVMPKLNEIKPGYRVYSPHIRNMRPNQNQNIRNIPNPSLIVRQQTQNRLGTITNPIQTQNQNQNQNNNQDCSSKDIQKVTQQPEKPKPQVEKPKVIEKVAEKSDISVSVTV